MKNYKQPSKKAETVQPKAAKQAAANAIINDYKSSIQLKAAEEDELLQGKFDTAQLKGNEEGELLQGKFDTTQLKGNDEELLQGKFDTAQLKNVEDEEPLQKKENNTGLPDNLKSGVENLSGYSMDDVNVHYNSSQPAELQAHAYAQGTDIHVAPGQEQHLPHEAWHVVQQKQGRVKPTMQMKGKVNVNDDAGLENEADTMGAKALNTTEKGSITQMKSVSEPTVQLIKASGLAQIGFKWFAKVWMDKDSNPQEKQLIFAQVEKETGFKMGTVFQKYDPFIRGGGSYVNLVKKLDKNHAKIFLQFLNDEIDLDSLDGELEKLAVIVCIAEVGRGYSFSVFGDLRRYLQDIIDGKDKWSNVKERFAPSLTYKEDNKDFVPEEDEESESYHSDSYDSEDHMEEDNDGNN
ncbi:eCIS core domain-containing protein [Flavobacterium hauense]